MTQFCLILALWVVPLWGDGSDQEMPVLASVKMGAPLPEDLPLPNRYHFARNKRDLVAFSHDEATGERTWVTLFADAAGRIVGKHVVQRRADAETVVLEFVVPASADHAPPKPDDKLLELGRNMAAKDTPYFSRFWKQQIEAGVNRAHGAMKTLGRSERVQVGQAGAKQDATGQPTGLERDASNQPAGPKRDANGQPAGPSRDATSRPASPKRDATSQPASPKLDATGQPAGPTRIDEYAWYISGWEPDPALLPQAGKKHEYPSLVTGSGSVLHPALTVAFGAHDLSGLQADGFDRTIRFYTTESRFDVRVTHLEQRVYRISIARIRDGDG